MALSAEIQLESTQNTLEVAVGLANGKVNLKVCGPVLGDKVLSYRNMYKVYHRPEETLAILKLHRHSASNTVTYTVTTIKGGKCLYKGIKFPPVGTVCKGIGYKLNRFFGKMLFRISNAEMTAWERSVAIEMRCDAMRHARTIVK